MSWCIIKVGQPMMHLSGSCFCIKGFSIGQQSNRPTGIPSGAPDGQSDCKNIALRKYLHNEYTRKQQIIQVCWKPQTIIYTQFKHTTFCFHCQLTERMHLFKFLISWGLSAPQNVHSTGQRLAL